MIEIKIPFKTPTVNQMYATFNGNRVKSKEARELNIKVKEIIDSLDYKPIKGKLKETIDIYSNWINKDGSIKKKDVCNYEKFINDAIFGNLKDMDDSQVFKIKLNKQQSDEEYSIIKIEEYNDI